MYVIHLSRCGISQISPLTLTGYLQLDKSIFGIKSELLCPHGVVDSFQACAIGGNSAINAGRK